LIGLSRVHAAFPQGYWTSRLRLGEATTQFDQRALACFVRGASAMSNNVYAEINLHFVWYVKNSLPVISQTIEPGLHQFLRNYSQKTEGLKVHGIGGTETHIHIAVSVPPTLPIAEWIGKLKGASSHFVNHELANRKVLEWQRGYGVVSFGTKNLQWVIDYICNQKECHRRGAAVARMERITSDEKS
jgi:putative transposase